ncbi:MAG: hypothetical protein AUI50_07340 [Crenarchaeota archaeon 13_1_40CM_2_52_14]|nr:MAG: hypothetical protein AUI50_07340 [Crenarchaeota archaeon 13_1_40CM_2_52_14]
MQYDLDGGQVWNRTLGNTNNVTISGISVGTDGIYVFGVNNTGLGSQKIWVFAEKHDVNGNKIWKTKFANITGPSGSASDSGLYVAGFASDNGLFPSDNGQPIRLLMSRYDANGGIVWTKNLANETSWDPEGSVLVYADPNGFYLAGSGLASISRYDTGGNSVWNRRLDNPGFGCGCQAYALSGDKTGIYLGGRDSLSPNNSFLRRYDLNGNILWTGKPDSAIARISANGPSVYSMENGLARYDSSNGNRLWIFPAYGSAIAAGESGVYLAESNGLLVSYSDSASLVLFGVNPPYSFVVVSTSVGVPVLMILLKKRSLNKRAQRIPAVRNDPKQTRN